MSAVDPERAGEPYHCCLCGRRDPRCLCKRCRIAHSPGGVLVPWVAALKREANRLTARERRWRGRVELVRLDALTDEQGS